MRPPFASSQASYRSFPPGAWGENSLIALLVLFPRDPLRWAPAGTLFEKKMRRARCKRNVFDFVLWCGGKLRAGDTRPYRASPGFGRGGSYPPETLHTDRRRAEGGAPYDTHRSSGASAASYRGKRIWSIQESWSSCSAVSATLHLIESTRRCVPGY